MTSFSPELPTSNLTLGRGSPLSSLFAELKLNWQHGIPSVERLNQIAIERYRDNWIGPTFIDQATINDQRYYEEIIDQKLQVPTRKNNWHDVFNALIWLQFPKTKLLLNRLHIHDIAQFGLHPRTHRRNQLTHFDECGLVLAIPESSVEQGNRLLSLLAGHQWQEVFCHQKDAWGRDLIPVIFGHANLEMLLNPFIGLTAKWLAVVVPDDYQAMTTEQKNAVLDACMVTRIQQLDGLSHKHIFKPIPLLGVPGWYHEQTTFFYENTAYFRPAPAHGLPTIQLPLIKK
jgi:hypothetical protein